MGMEKNAPATDRGDPAALGGSALAAPAGEPAGESACDRMRADFLIDDGVIAAACAFGVGDVIGAMFELA